METTILSRVNVLGKPWTHLPESANALNSALPCLESSEASPCRFSAKCSPPNKQTNKEARKGFPKVLQGALEDLTYR